jgi:glycerol-3-phosphate dehydrogenase
MKRDLKQLGKTHFDLVVIGAGIHGACIARDAALRGLRTALIDKGDLCSQTSHNSLKIIHGGIRYLQHLNFKRVLESIQEQRIWLTVAPKLVKPLQFVMPTYGYGMRGPIAMWIGIKVYEALGLGRNRQIPKFRRIPSGKVISKEHCKAMIPGLEEENLTGAALWYDAHMMGADEAVIQIAMSAFDNGAQVANYVSAQQFIMDRDRVCGIVARDELTGKTFDIKGTWTINATGPWASRLFSSIETRKNQDLNLTLSKSINIVTRKQIFGDFAVGLQSKRSSDSVIGATKRLYFFTPWKGSTLIGTTHFPYGGNPDSFDVTAEEVEEFIREINDVYPQAELSLEDVNYCYKGLTPAEKAEEKALDSSEVRRAHQSNVIDHSKDGVLGILSILGVKYTTARLVAEKAVNLICRELGNSYLKCVTRTLPIEQSHLIQPDSDFFDTLSFGQFCQDQVEHSMVQHLTDLVLRRMDLAARGILTAAQLEICLETMSRSLGWDFAKKINELESLKSACPDPDLRENINAKLSEIRQLGNT